MVKQEMARTIGLAGAVFTLVGYVVGAGIFILPGQLAGSAGPGVSVSFLIAAVPALFTCVVSAHVGNVFPTSGANYVATRRVFGRFVGFLVVWGILVCSAVAIAFVSYGFADYLTYFLPKLSPMVVAGIVVVLFGIINLVGVRVAVWLQGVLVIWFVVTLLAFGIGGLATGNPANLRPVFPNGFGAVLVAAIPAYFSFSGFAVIAELGEEIKNPHRNIPLCLAISFIAVLTMYTLVPLGLTATVPWAELQETPAAIGTAATRFLPNWAAGAIALSALAAAATSVNGILMAQARDIFALARDGMFPRRFGHVNARTGTPDAAIVLLTAVSLACVLVGASITEYAVITVLGVMGLQILVSLAVLRLPAVAPVEFAAARFKLAGPARAFFCLGLMLMSLGFVVVGVMESPRSTVILLVAMCPGIAYYALRLRGRELPEYARERSADPPD